MGNFHHHGAHEKKEECMACHHTCRSCRKCGNRCEKCRRYGRLRPLALALAGGFVGGIGTLFLGWSAVVMNIGVSMVYTMSSMYLGFEPTMGGAITGGAWGFADGFICGLLFAYFYNAFLCCCFCGNLCSCRMKCYSDEPKDHGSQN